MLSALPPSKTQTRMKVFITQHMAKLISILIITSLIIAMISDGNQSLPLKWFSLSLLWCIALGYLKNPLIFYSIIKDKIFVSYLIFIGWAIFSSLILSTAKSVSIFMLIPFIGGLLSYLIAFSANDKKELYFDWLLMGVGLFLSFYTYYQKSILGIPRPYGLLSNWNAHAAVLAIIILPWILRYAVKPFSSPLQLICLSIFSFLFAIAMGLTLSRGALLIIITAFLGLSCFAWRQKIFFKQCLFLIAALIFGFLLSSVLFDSDIVNRIGNISEANSLVSLGSGRHLLWIPAWEMYLDKPLFGWGLGTFRLLYMYYKPPFSGEAGGFVHNDYLQFLLELGPLGLILFICFVLIILKRLTSLLLTSNTEVSFHKIEAYIYLLIPVGLLIHTIFTFHLYHFSIQILLGCYLGRSSRHFQKNLGISSDTIKPKTLKYTGVHSAFTFFIILLITSFGCSIYFLNKAGYETNPQAKLDAYWKASLFFPALERYDSYHADLLSKQLEQNNDSSQKHQQIATQALSTVNTAIEKMPFNAINYMTKASILKSTNKNVSLLYEQYEKALTYQPSSLSIRHQYAQLLIENNQYKTALAILWAAWNRINAERYRVGINYLAYQLKINDLYGSKQNSSVIKNEIKQLEKISKNREGGVYVFKHAHTI